MWAVPWSNQEIINTIFLTVTTAIILATPIIYIFNINLRDPLARSVLVGMGAPGLAFLVTLAALIAYHAGWEPPMATWNWITRATYVCVSLGSLLFLIGILAAVREVRALRDKTKREESGSE